MNGGFLSRRELARRKNQSQGTKWVPAENIALGVLIAASLVCFLIVGAVLAVVSWQMLSENESTTMVTTTTAPMDSSADSYFYVYDNQDLYWSILGGSCFSIYSFLGQLTAVLLPVTLLSVIVVVGVSVDDGIVDKLTCKLCSKYLYELSKYINCSF